MLRARWSSGSFKYFQAPLRALPAPTPPAASCPGDNEATCLKLHRHGRASAGCQIPRPSLPFKGKNAPQPLQAQGRTTSTGLSKPLSLGSNKNLGSCWPSCRKPDIPEINTSSTLKGCSGFCRGAQRLRPPPGSHLPAASPAAAEPDAGQGTGPKRLIFSCKLSKRDVGHWDRARLRLRVPHIWSRCFHVAELGSAPAASLHICCRHRTPACAGSGGEAIQRVLSDKRSIKLCT